MIKRFFIRLLGLNDIPLIATSKGNIPVEALEHRTEWTVTERYTQFKEYFYLKGELVKESSHVWMKQGYTAGAIAGTF